MEYREQRFLNTTRSLLPLARTEYERFHNTIRGLAY
jgi:hypothetical protein